MTSPYITSEANRANDKRDSLTEFETAVNRIIETLIDGTRGFEAAAAKAEGELEQQLTAMATQRRKTAEEMIVVAADEDMDPVTLDEGKLSGVLHRSWISIRDAVQGDPGVADAALSGERHAKKEIEKVLEKDLPTPLANIAERALEEIESNISTLEPMSS